MIFFSLSSVEFQRLLVAQFEYMNSTLERSQLVLLFFFFTFQSRFYFYYLVDGHFIFFKAFWDRNEFELKQRTAYLLLYVLFIYLKFVVVFYSSVDIVMSSTLLRAIIKFLIISLFYALYFQQLIIVKSRGHGLDWLNGYEHTILGWTTDHSFDSKINIVILVIYLCVVVVYIERWKLVNFFF